MSESEDELWDVVFLERVRSYEEVCAEITARELPKMGSQAPECYEAIGMALALLDGAASCRWGCAGGDHRLEFLVGKATNSAYSALCLLSRGYYDQALAIARTLGEIANLLALFVADRSKLTTWATIDERTRRRDYSAVKVRLAIERLGRTAPIDERRYGLCQPFRFTLILICSRRRMMTVLAPKQFLSFNLQEL